MRAYYTLGKRFYYDVRTEETSMERPGTGNLDAFADFTRKISQLEWEKSTTRRGFFVETNINFTLILVEVDLWGQFVFGNKN